MVVLGAAGCGSGDDQSAEPCRPAPVRTANPPAFTDIPDVPDDGPHAISADGQIVAFFFVHPMRVHRPGGPDNKILWVVGDRPDAAPLKVAARQEGRTVRSSADGGGGSGQIQRGFHEFPAPGCWRLDLRSGERHTTLDVRVAP